MSEGILEEEIREERRKNLKDIIRMARWEAEMVKKLGREWFRMRDQWLTEAHKASEEMMKNPQVRKAVIESILARDRLKTRREPHPNTPQ